MHFLPGCKQRVSVDGERSDLCSVASGVSHGTVLGPVLFLIFINDIANNIDSKIRLFADDCLLYRDIRTRQDQNILQWDLNTLHQWSQLWQMQFHVSNCYAMRLTSTRNKKLTCNYTMDGQALTETMSTPNMGVQLSHNLKWNNHTNVITYKANRMLGFIRRNLNNTPQTVRETAYKTLVRPRLEYCSIRVIST
jgi:ribonuclease P/MRP protein subunit RPP40